MCKEWNGDSYMEDGVFGIEDLRESYETRRKGAKVSFVYLFLYRKLREFEKFWLPANSRILKVGLLENRYTFKPKFFQLQNIPIGRPYDDALLNEDLDYLREALRKAREIQNVIFYNDFINSPV